MTHKKSSFWRFLFSLIPGVGERVSEHGAAERDG